MKQLVPLVAEEENLSATRVPAEAGDENTQLSQPGTIDETSSSVDKCVSPSTNNQSENSADSHPVPTTKNTEGVVKLLSSHQVMCVLIHLGIKTGH